MRISEFKVWKSIVDWIEDHGGIVVAACPPGSSVYDYNKFCLVDPISGKRDEPDILLLWEKYIFFIECKSTLSGIKSKREKYNSNESDIEKLKRIKVWANQGRYDQQLLNNFNVKLTDKTKLKIGIGYATSDIKKVKPIHDIIQFIVTEDYQIKIVSE